MDQVFTGVGLLVEYLFCAIMQVVYALIQYTHNSREKEIKELSLSHLSLSPESMSYQKARLW